MTETQHNGGYWNATAAPHNFPALVGNMEVDIAIIGAGVVGITTARMLKDRGQTVAVIEADRVGRQATGKSTAKVTSQHGLNYQVLEQKFGRRCAGLYAEAQESGLRAILGCIARHGIDCDVEARPAWVYTCDETQVAALEKEADITRLLGLPSSLSRTTDLPFEVLAALRFDQQAQLHPVRYLGGLARTIPGEGCHVFENSRAIDWEPTRVETARGSVKARHVVMATHLPLGTVGGYYSKAFPHAEPVIAARLNQVPDGMYISVEQPRHSFRTHRNAAGEVYAIASGGRFKPGDTEQEQHCMQDIEHWLGSHFATGPVEYRWINEDYASVDSAPYVGWSSSIGGSYLVATGFAAWGISNGTAAAMILADLATGHDHRWLELFDAKRVKPVAGGREFLKESAEIAGHLVSGYLSRKPDSCDELGNDEAAIMKIDGHNTAVYRDAGGALHAVSAVCSHLGCLVGWNRTDRTWDCPCHGSRFDLDGEVIHGPATQPLASRFVDKPG